MARKRGSALITIECVDSARAHVLSVPGEAIRSLDALSGRFGRLGARGGRADDARSNGGHERDGRALTAPGGARGERRWRLAHCAPRRLSV